MMEPAAIQVRIKGLGDEVERLRRERTTADGQAQALLLKVTEIQLNLAVQDRTLGKLEAAVHGNGRPGLCGRVERLERAACGVGRVVWLLVAAAVTAAAKLLLDRTR